MKTLLGIPLVLVLLFPGPLMAAGQIDVVASFSILGDLVKNVGGDRVRVHTLVGEDSDAHVYQPTPTDAKTLARAQLVVVNGFGFEGWIDRLIKSSGYRGKVLVASDHVEALRRAQVNAHNSGDRNHADPHAWQDLSEAIRYVDNIEHGLSGVDPDGKAIYGANASRYKNQIVALDAQIRKTINAIPPERRKIVTSHDAFGYFGRAYGVTFISPIGVSTEAEPSAADVGRIIQQIRRDRISAVFVESLSDPRLLERIRIESGAKVGGTLYSDCLSRAGGPASTYLDMMKHNASRIAESLTDN